MRHIPNPKRTDIRQSKPNRYRQLEQATQRREHYQMLRRIQMNDPSGEFSNELLERGRDHVKKSQRFERRIADLQHGHVLGYLGAYYEALERTFNRRAMPDRVKANSSELTARRILRDRKFRNRVREEYATDVYGVYKSLHRLLRFC